MCTQHTSRLHASMLLHSLHCHISFYPSALALCICIFFCCWTSVLTMHNYTNLSLLVVAYLHLHDDTRGIFTCTRDRRKVSRALEKQKTSFSSTSCLSSYGLLPIDRQPINFVAHDERQACCVPWLGIRLPTRGRHHSRCDAQLQVLRHGH